PFTVDHLDHHARALVKAGMVGGRHGEHALRYRQVLDLFQRIAQRLAELRRARLGTALERLGNGGLDQHTGIPHVAAERVDGARAVFGFVLGLVVERRFLDGIVVRQLVSDEQRARRQVHVVAVLATDAQDVVVGRAVGLIHDALVAAVLELALGQRHRCTGTGHQDAVRRGSDQLQHLSGHAGVVAVVALPGHHLDALGFRGFLHYIEPAFAVSVVVADESQRLDAVLDHGVGQCASHQLIVLRGLEHPLARAFHRLNDTGVGRYADHGGGGFTGHVYHGQGTRRNRSSYDHVDFVVGNKLAHVAHGSRGVRAVVQYDVLDLLTRDFRGQEGHGVALRYAQRGGGPRAGDGYADLDLRGCHQWQRQRKRTGQHRQSNGLLSIHRFVSM